MGTCNSRLLLQRYRKAPAPFQTRVCTSPRRLPGSRGLWALRAQVIGDPKLAEQAASAGFSCQITGTGAEVLQYWQLTLTIPEVIAVLLAFYAFFHAASYLALSQLYRQRR